MAYPTLTQATNFLSSITNPNFGLNPKKEIIRVNGIQEAKDFKLEKGENIALIDCNEDILYIKDCDEIGHVNLKIYECVDKTEEYLSKFVPANISRAEFDDIKSSLEEVRKLLLNGGHKKNEHNDTQQDLFTSKSNK